MPRQRGCGNTGKRFIRTWKFGEGFDEEEAFEVSFEGRWRGDKGFQVEQIP